MHVPATYRGAMSPHRRRLPLLLGAVLLLTACAPGSGSPVVSLSATAPAATPPAATPPASASAPDSAGAVACTDGVALITGSRRQVTFSGACERVELDGTDLDVELVTSQVESVIIRGDDNEVDVDAVAELTVEGQENDIDAEYVGSATIRGNGNELDVGGELGAVSVAGDDNEVTAGALGAVEQSGARNRIERD